MLTLVGEDRPAIVARVTHALYEGECHLGEASMMRLGGNFCIMLMVSSASDKKTLAQLLEPIVDSLGLHMHIDSIAGELHKHLIPDVRITVSGADRAGIVADVTGALAEAGLHILDLESDVAGTEQAPVYIMHIEGNATEGMQSIEAVMELIRSKGIDASMSAIDMVLG
jgi:glycine cleavage system transcriptional repressor